MQSKQVEFWIRVPLEDINKIANLKGEHSLVNETTPVYVVERKKQGKEYEFIEDDERQFKIQEYPWSRMLKDQEL